MSGIRASMSDIGTSIPNVGEQDASSIFLLVLRAGIYLDLMQLNNMDTLAVF